MYQERPHLLGLPQATPDFRYNWWHLQGGGVCRKQT